MADSVRLVITFPGDISLKLTEIAGQRRTSVSEQVRQAVYQWLGLFDAPDTDRKREPHAAETPVREMRLVPFEDA